MPIGSLHGTDLAVELARIESESRGVPRLRVKSDSKMRIAATRAMQARIRLLFAAIRVWIYKKWNLARSA